MAVSDDTMAHIWRTENPAATPTVVEDVTTFQSQRVVSVAVCDDMLVSAQSHIDWGQSPPIIHTDFVRVPMGTICYLADEYRDG